LGKKARKSIKELKADLGLSMDLASPRVPSYNKL